LIHVPITVASVVVRYQKRETMLRGTSQLVNNGANHLGNAGDEQLLRESHSWVVKDPR
jgi:hypothetical protein